MQKLRFYLRVLLMPVVKYFKNSFSLIRIKYSYPTIKLDEAATIKRTTFGLYNHVALNATILDSTFGDFSYVGFDSFVHNVRVGKFTCIGPSVSIGLGEHPVAEFISIHPVFYSLAKQTGITFSESQLFKEYSDTIIGHDVWIGANAVVRAGIKIGNGVIIAAGAVVTKDVPSYAIVGGVPAKIIRYRFSSDEIDKLETLKWWDKDHSWLKSHSNKMVNIQNIDALLRNS